MDNKAWSDVLPVSSGRRFGEITVRRMGARGGRGEEEVPDATPDNLPVTEASPALLLAVATGELPASAAAVFTAAEIPGPSAGATNGWALAGGVVVMGALAGASRNKDDAGADGVPVDHTAPTATIRHPGDSTLVLELMNYESVADGKGPLVDTPTTGVRIEVDSAEVMLTSRNIKNAGQSSVFRTSTSDFHDYSALADAFNATLVGLGYDGDTSGKSRVTVRVGPKFDAMNVLTGVPILGVGHQLIFQSEGPERLGVPLYDVWQYDAGIPASVGGIHQRLYDRQAAFSGQVPFTISFDEPVSGLTLDDFSVSGGSKLALTGAGASYTLTVLPNANTQGTLSVHLPAGAVHDAAGNGNATAVDESVLFDTRNATYTPGQPMIDLGVYGRLIAPVQSDGGAWYYYWDRSGDGSSADQGLLNGGHDAVTHDELDALFALDAAGQIGGGINTSESIRYASLNGVRLALPTANGGAPLPAGIGRPQPGTEVDNRPAGEPNVTYNDLLGLWDGHNGGTTATGQSGVPAGWAGGTYWSASASVQGHLAVNMLTGSVFDDVDARTAHVALWVV